MVQPSKELLNRAFRRANAQRHNKKIKNEASQERNRTARTMETFQKELGAPLGLYVSSFPKVEALTSFDAALLDLTVGKGTYEQTLDRVAAVKKTVSRMAKELATRGARAQTKKEAELVREQGLADLEKYLKNAAGAVDSLLDIAKLLRRLPVVDPRLPTVALVGAPNVGKSSLVQALSSGQPEIQNYPFTTRTIKMGHFYVCGQRHQVTDTPGLLARAEADRNVMERLTLATLDFLPTAVLFVADLTEECGVSAEQQWAVRVALKARFPRKRWVDVFSKADLLEGMRRRGQEERGSAAAKSNQSEVDLDPSLVKLPSDWPRYLPHAIWASSFTDAGCAQLKGALLEALAHPESGEEMEMVKSSEGMKKLDIV